MSAQILDIFESFQQVKVLIVGDIMLDHYIIGNVNRVSPEAPVPVVEVITQENRLGGAANVALNLKNLGATPILCSVIGDDTEGYAMQKLLSLNEINPAFVILDQERKTTVKSRILAKQQQLIRYDIEQRTPLNENTELLFLDNIVDIIYNQKPHVVILQDYNKGVLTPKIIANIIHNCKRTQIPVAVDPKKNNFWEYKHCTLFKPNLKEAAEGLGIEINPTRSETLKSADKVIRQQLKNQFTVITLSEKGMFVSDETDVEIIPAYPQQIADVSGAGDTVISLFGMGLALGLDIFATAELANIAAGLVCEQVGVVPINLNQLIKEATKILGA